MSSVKCAFPDSGPCINRISNTECGRGAEMCLHTPAADQVRRDAQDFARFHQLNCLEHYHHAKAKHPYFADNWWFHYNQPLIHHREFLRKEIEAGCVSVFSILNCEIAEIADAFDQHDTESAKSECYDAIAVLLRMVDVLDQRQKLGKENE